MTGIGWVPLVYAGNMAGYMPAPIVGDAFGVALADAIDGDEVMTIAERSDGYVAHESTDMYFAPPAGWPSYDQDALDLLAGRVLDIGAGAGRLSLALQEQGHAPVALDTSPGAIEVCRMRGVEETFLGPIDALAEGGVEPFDAAALLGHNLGLLGSRHRSQEIFTTLRGLLKPGARVVGTCLEPYGTDNPVHLGYHEANRRAGRLGGRIVLRVRYGLLTTDWFDYLFTTPAELEELAHAAGWRVEYATEPTPTYLAVLTPDN